MLELNDPDCSAFAVFDPCCPRPFRAGHILVETALVATILFLLLQRSYKPDKKPLTEKARCVLCRPSDAARHPAAARTSSELGLVTTHRRSTRNIALRCGVPVTARIVQEIDQLCDEWTPDPLIPSMPENVPSLPVLKGCALGHLQPQSDAHAVPIPGCPVTRLS